MQLRTATPDDTTGIALIYDPIVRDTTISFETEPPGPAEMRARIEKTLPQLPWLVAEDNTGAVCGYAYAGKHRERPAYQWSVDVSVYVHRDQRGLGLGRRLYQHLLSQLRALGYRQAFAGIALPNAASVGLHEAMGFTPIGIYQHVGFKHGAWHDVGWWQLDLGGDGPPEPPRPFDGGGALAEP